MPIAMFELLSDSLIEALTKSTSMEQAEPNYELSETKYGETLVGAGVSPAPLHLAPGLSARETTSMGKAGAERLRDLSMPRERREQRKAWIQVRERRVRALGRGHVYIAG
jgi:hypothetical protein